MPVDDERNAPVCLHDWKQRCVGNSLFSETRWQQTNPPGNSFLRPDVGRNEVLFSQKNTAQMEVDAFNAQRYGSRVAEKPASSAALTVTEKSA